MRKLIPLAVLTVAAVTGLSMTAAIFRAERQSAAARFELLAVDTADRINDRVNQQLDLLGSVHAFMAANGASLEHDEFSNFVAQMRFQGRFGSMQGVGYAALVKSGAEPALERKLSRDYDIERQIWPQTTDEVWRTPIVYLEPHDENNSAALGYDMYSEPTRRAAMEAALRELAPAATAPVELIQEIDGKKQVGFLIYIPLFRPSDGDDPSVKTREDVAGFVYAPFRAGDFHDAILSHLSSLNVLVETTDIANGASTLLFRSPGFDDPSVAANPTVQRRFWIAGRRWAVKIRQADAVISPTRHPGTLVLGVLSLLFAIALAASTRAQLNAVDSARKLNAMSMQMMQQKERMLQEMKHRIKNSIARVMAIARQTASSSSNLSEFNESFAARLQAMANAQDMLTRSHWQRGDLRELLLLELEQVFGGEFATDHISGQDVELNEKASQALSLVFHELATNALKYGGDQMAVTWATEKEASGYRLRLTWSEKVDTAPDLSKKGFGTRLIDASIVGELGGTIERTYDDGVLTIVIIVPIKSLN